MTPHLTSSRERGTEQDWIEARIAALGDVLVAYSGGVDSTVVLELAHRALGQRARGVIARSASLPAAELEAALALAGDRGIHVEVLDTRELELEGYVQNGPDRCYFCKTELYGALASLAATTGATILDGFNREDRGDWRPGRKAAAELGVVSPLDEAGLGKAEVRDLARTLGLPNWDKPAAACLSSRIPYGIPVSVEALARVEAAEAVLKAEGFRQLRVRDADAAATIEVEAGEVDRLLRPELLERVSARLRELGYRSVDVDSRGYRRGALNEALVR